MGRGRLVTLSRADNAIQACQRAFQEEHDFVESLVYSKDSMVLMTGTMTDEYESSKVGSVWRLDMGDWRLGRTGTCNPLWPA